MSAPQTVSMSKVRLVARVGFGIARGAVIATIAAGEIPAAGALLIVSFVLMLVDTATNDYAKKTADGDSPSWLPAVRWGFAFGGLAVGFWMLLGTVPGVVLLATVVTSLVKCFVVTMFVVSLTLPPDSPSAIRLQDKTKDARL